MNIIEVSKKENIGKEYKVYKDGIYIGKWVIRRVATSNEFEFYKEDERMSDLFYTSQILKMEFDEVIGWIKVPVDTKVLVSKNGKDWYRRYFAKYVNNMVYCFDSGATSFSVQNDDSDISAWKYAKLYQE